MASDFQNYIKQLQELESAENSASLKAICTMNKNVLEFFPTIWRSINRLVESENVPLDVIQDIKEHLSILSDCKRDYDKLSSADKSKYYASNICDLLTRKDEVTIQEVTRYEADLIEMLRRNASQLELESTKKVDSEEMSYEQKFLSGVEIPSDERLLLAAESANKDVIVKLKKSKSISILEALQKNKSLNEAERAYLKNRIETILNQKKQEGKTGCLGCLSVIMLLLGTMVGGGSILLCVVTIIISIL